ncbi:hypothetical protein PTTG_01296 [Puccinia triticina 1-1 BBBD Race 1]|uniref:F-box domain-containing protein n=2 Tax=Puccinia triticina TaxID=208348 RepID=A0A180G2Q4_PUCT1|nr:uncharacterized protein PtA15_12A112 [Puccinia triticina]OAV86719.1 hypothetical protein PTTG_01296 [Puccinia triticina 1-1 BBBD Race 1]WAQ90126.1 hypothetical protein PtA15_12A112 [Puccinia triticina]WAR61411.1 hypothetical protein PtB15_12B96 [Puccinia triticina]
MATLSDLPAEIVHRIIGYIILPEFGEVYKSDHPKVLDPNAIEAGQRKLRPHELLYPLGRPLGQATPGGFWYFRQDVSSNPLLPLSLINRTFQACAQEILFKNVPLMSRRRAGLLLRALTRSSSDDQLTGARMDSSDKPNTREECDSEEMRPSGTNPHPHLSRLAQHVRTLQLRWRGLRSMHNGTKGGCSLFCDIIRSCPLLKNVAIQPTFSKECREPLLDALASRQLIKEFVILRDDSDIDERSSTFQWSLDDLLGRLFPKWDFLETVELRELVGESKKEKSQIGTAQKPKLNCAIQSMILHDPKINADELSVLLNSFRDSLRTLEIDGPCWAIGRAGICRILKECTNPELECLKLYWCVNCYEGRRDFEDLESDDPETNPGLLDIIFKSPSALRNLKSLSFAGKIATPKLFERLPDSIVKIAWSGDCITLYQFSDILSSTREDKEILPNLKCCSIHSFGYGTTREVVEAACKARGACAHIDLISNIRFRANVYDR